MVTIPPQSPGVGGTTPTPQPNEGQPSMKSETTSFRSGEMSTSLKSESVGGGNLGKVTSPGNKLGFLFSILLGAGKTEKSEIADGAALNVLKHLKNAFDRV